MNAFFCLVHGSGQGPRGWDLLVAELAKRGFPSLCVDLPTDQPSLSATGYAAEIANVIDQVEEEDRPVVVVAHSISGLFLPLVAHSRPNVRGLVYLAAVIPVPGESFYSQFQKHPAMYNPEFIGKDPAVDEALAREFMFHDVASPEVMEWSLTTVRMMYAKGAIQEPCPLESMPAGPPPMSFYVSCTADRTISPEWWERAARERLGVEPIRLEGAGHFPQVSRPAELAELLTGVAAICCNNGAVPPHQYSSVAQR